ncbi:MAG TPA: hypothetical protein VG222_19455 [Vicinamibacterales bacterium]|nr:hypothetical protein [Vicinamibacterales bacterium]
MKRRTLLQWLAATAAILPFDRIRLYAQPRELTPEAIATLHEIAATVIPASLGASQVRDTADKFIVWIRGYREGVPLEHGYGHPRLRRSPASPVPTYIAQLAALDAAARAKGAAWGDLDLETRRALIDASLAKANVTALPGRPSGQHVVADLMAFYFRSTEANDACYRAAIGREVCRPIAITTKRPEPLKPADQRGHGGPNLDELSTVSSVSSVVER